MDGNKNETMVSDCTVDEKIADTSDSQINLAEVEITSILNTLENGTYLLNHKRNNAHPVGELIERIDEFSLWLNTTFASSILNTGINAHKMCLKKLDSLRQDMKTIVANLQKRNLTDHSRKFVCTACGERIVTSTYEESVWRTIQRHEHIEQRLANPTKMIPFNSLTPEKTRINNAPTETNDEEFDTFKFNFMPQYDEEIRLALYPPEITNPVRAAEGLSDFSVQCRGPIVFCLFCKCELPMISRDILLHVEGNRHMKCVTHPGDVNILHLYHSVWLKLEPVYQVHQIHFNPLSPSKMFCKICVGHITFEELKEHLIGSHKGEFFKALLQNPRHKMFQHSLKPLLLKLYQYTSEVTNGESNGFACELVTQDREDSEASTSSSSPSQSPNERREKVTKTSINTSSTPDVSPRVAEAQSSNSPKQSPAKKDAKPPEIHKIIKAMATVEINSFFDIMENRHQPYLTCFSETPDKIQCKSCDVLLEKNPQSLKKHMVDSGHKRNSGITPKKFKFYCDICGIHYSKEITWDDHLEQTSHKLKCSTAPVIRRNQLTEYECHTCNMVIFGDEISLKRHQYVYKYRHKNREIKLPETVKNMFVSEAALHKEGVKLTMDANSVIASQDRLKACCFALEEALSAIYKGCRAYPFGSRVSGLGNKDSDLDVFMDTGNMYNGDIKQDPKSQKQLVMDANRLFSKNKQIFDAVNPIPMARTPIVQVYHKPTDMDCDLSFRHGLSVENTMFLRVCLSLQPITQPFILVLKKWSQYCKLNEHITTYALAMMAIFYLQTQGYLLSVKILKKLNPEPPPIIDGWETIKYKSNLEFLRVHVKTYQGSLKQLLQDFFKYYTTFKYQYDVVCPLLGCPIPKQLFIDEPMGKNLPPEMARYVYKLHTDPAPELFRALSPLCIQDPFDLSHNLTKACQPNIVEKLKAYCDLTYKHLDAIK